MTCKSETKSFWFFLGAKNDILAFPVTYDMNETQRKQSK